MARPMAFGKQLLLTGVLAGGAYGAWHWREDLSQFSGRMMSAVGADVSQQSSASGNAGQGAAKAGRGGGQAGARGGGGRAARPVAPVIVAALATREDDLTIELVGTARAERSVSLRIKATGEIEKSALEAGRAVRADEPLVWLNDDDAQLAVDLAMARKEAADRELERNLKLQASNAGSGKALDDARTAAEEAKIELRRAQKALEDRTLLAPFDGVLGLPAVETGDWVDSGDVLAGLDDRARLLIEADLPETFLKQLAEGVDVTARSVSAPGAVFSGEIVAIDSRIDPAKRTARIRIAIDNPSDALRPGASFTAELKIEGEAYPATPELSLQYGREGLYVWRVIDDQVERAPVRLIRRRAGLVLIESTEGADPLKLGDLIVVEGAQRLSDGAKVEVVGQTETPSNEDAAQ